MTLISLEINKSFTDCDEGYSEIRCAVDGNLVVKISSILLIRSKEVVAALSGDNVLKDTNFTNRTGVTVKYLISNTTVSYLSIRIMSSVVNHTKDEGFYYCLLQGRTADNGFFRDTTSKKMLNITGNIEITLCV